MRKIPLLLLCLCLVLPAAASAGGTVVTALATEVDPASLVSVAVDARITGFDSAAGTVTLDLIIPESYSFEDIDALQVGDSIFTRGREVEIRSMEEDDQGYIILNREENGDGPDTLWLYQYLDMNYQIMDGADNTWTLLGSVTVPVPDRLLFLDEIDPSTLESLYRPAVHDRDGFLALLAKDRSGDPGFDLNNVMVVFDSRGELALVRRYYVPWQ